MASCLRSTISFGAFAHLLQLLSGFIPNALDKRGTHFLSFHLTRQAFPSSCLRETGEPLSISVSLGKLHVTPSVRSKEVSEKGEKIYNGSPPSTMLYPVIPSRITMNKYREEAGNGVCGVVVATDSLSSRNCSPSTTLLTTPGFRAQVKTNEPEPPTKTQLLSKSFPMSLRQRCCCTIIAQPAAVVVSLLSMLVLSWMPVMPDSDMVQVTADSRYGAGYAGPRIWCRLRRS
ncbi:hypothetical protein TNIN_82771 [Trichonephila inaurata madagascariensis]|uniref:Uncharacterized protein n=1 Tax=Trichonephila inaurata madagascariensis TaxID=2747483 RepID=A0A8X7CMH7_9ARAC|nr:hypothetical protein TNIN_82771 [Trichonephila inaurata madagascariensis]